MWNPGPSRRFLSRWIAVALVTLSIPFASTGANAADRHWCGDSTGSLPNTYRTTHFVFFYDTIAGGLTVAQYGSVLEHVWATEIKSFGWAAPPSYTPNPAPGGKFPVRIASYAGDYGAVFPQGAYAGSVGDNPATPWNEGDALASCMVLNRDFSSLVAVPLDGLKVTAAHEFFHAITNGLGDRGDLDRNYREGGASWMEDEVYDSINDSYQYLYPLWGESMGAFPDTPDIAAYGYWLVWRGLTEQYGTGVPGGAEDVMQRILELVSKGKKELVATEQAFKAQHTYLFYAIHQFAVAARFMKPCAGGYVEPLCFEEANAYQVNHPANFPVDGTVTMTNGYRGSIRDDYSSNWVLLPSSATPYQIYFKNESSKSPLFWSVACDTGTDIQLDMWGPIDPGITGGLGVDESACAGPMYLTVTNGHRSAGNPTTSPKADYHVWVPYVPMTGSISWTVQGSAAGTDGASGDPWSETWSETGAMTVKVKRDPVNVPDYLVVDDGSSYTLSYSDQMQQTNSQQQCTVTTTGTGSGSGSPTTGGYLGSTWPNLDPPDPTDAYPDILGLGGGTPMSYSTSTSGCGSSGSTGPTTLNGPFAHGIGSLPACVPAAVAGQDAYTAGYGFVGAWDAGKQAFGFSCSATVAVPGGSQLVTISGSVSYPALP
jgi:hypothetical protein